MIHWIPITKSGPFPRKHVPVLLYSNGHYLSGYLYHRNVPEFPCRNGMDYTSFPVWVAKSLKGESREFRLELLTPSHWGYVDITPPQGLTHNPHI